MLVLSRKKNEAIVINGNIRIEVLQIKGKQIRLGISAPSSMRVLRGELSLQEQAPDKEPEDAKPATESAVVDCGLHHLVGAVLASA